MRVGHSWGRGGGLRKGGSLLWLSVSLWSLFSLKGDQMQWAGQSESIHGSQRCVSENMLNSMIRDMVLQGIGSLPGLLVLKTALLPPL